MRRAGLCHLAGSPLADAAVSGGRDKHLPLNAAPVQPLQLPDCPAVGSCGMPRLHDWLPLLAHSQLVLFTIAQRDIHPLRVSASQTISHMCPTCQTSSAAW